MGPQLAYFRTGNRNARNIYQVDLDQEGNPVETHKGCTFDPEDGPLWAAALNAAHGTAEPNAAPPVALDTVP